MAHCSPRPSPLLTEKQVLSCRRMGLAMPQTTAQRCCASFTRPPRAVSFSSTARSVRGEACRLRTGEEFGRAHAGAPLLPFAPATVVFERRRSFSHVASAYSFCPPFRTGRKLIDAGLIVGADMTPECALAKLGYVIAKVKQAQRAFASALPRCCPRSTEHCKFNRGKRTRSAEP